MQADVQGVKSESVTLRFDSEVIKNLRHEAQQKNLSFNGLVNQLVKEHISWHANAPAAGFIAVRRPFVMDIMTHLSEQDVISIAEHVAKTTLRDSILFIEREYTLKSSLDYVHNWIKMSGYNYRHEETHDNGQHKYIYLIQHDMGTKWSIYLSGLYKYLFYELLGNKCKIEIINTENTSVITIVCL